MTKICSKCKIEKDVCFFSKQKISKDGFYSSCKECKKIYNLANKEKNSDYAKKYRELNKDYLNKKTLEWFKNNPHYRKEWVENNIDYQKYYYKKNKISKLIKVKNYRSLNKKKISKRHVLYVKNRCLVDKAFKLKIIMRGRLSNYIKSKNLTKHNKTFDIIGLTPIKLKEYLESLFTEGMTWDNHGFYGWHIDHKIPLSHAGDDINKIYELSHYTNLQPLWWYDNLAKSDKIVPK